MVRLADKERVFQLLIHRLNLVGDMSLAQFEAWFGPLENVVWDAPPSAVDWGEDFWMGFRTFMLQEYNPRMPYSCQIRFPEYVEACMELPVHFSKESLKRPNPYQSSTGTNAAGTRGGGSSRGGKSTRVGSSSGLMSGSGFYSLRGSSWVRRSLAWHGPCAKMTRTNRQDPHRPWLACS